MALAVKICGLTDPRRSPPPSRAARAGSASCSTRPRRARSAPSGPATCAQAPADRTTVGVFVDPDDALLDQVLARVPLEALQLHGAESPERVRAIKARTGCAVIKALQVAEPGDLAPVPSYAAVADMLLFDARPPKEPGACRAATASPSTGACSRTCGSAARGCSPAACRPTISPPRSRCAVRPRSTCRPASSPAPAARTRPRSGTSSRSPAAGAAPGARHLRNRPSSCP